jgi:O-antigen ligase
MVRADINRHQSLTAAEALALAAVVLSPVFYGGASDTARYILVATLLCTWVVYPSCPTHVSGVVLPALLLSVFLVAQTVAGHGSSIGTSVETTLIGIALLGVLAMWSSRGGFGRGSVRICGAIVAACTGQALWGAVQARVAPGRVYGIAVAAGSPYGSFVNHNHFAGFVEMGMFVAAGLTLGLFWRRRTVTPAVLMSAAAALVMASAVVASGSRGGFLALTAGAIAFVGLVGFAVRSQWARRIAFIALGFSLLLAVLAVPTSTRTRLVRVVSAAPDASGQYRLDLAEATIRTFLSAPVLGVGFGSFADAVTAFKRDHGDVRTTHAENDVLEYLTEGGIIGMGLLLWLCYAVLSRALTRLKTTRDPTTKGIVVGGLSALFAIAVHSFLDFNMHIPSNALLAATLAGLVSAGSPTESQAEAAARPGRRWLPGLVRAVFLFLACAAAWRAWGAFELRAAEELGRTREGVARLDGVVRRHSYLAEAYRLRGLALRALALGEQYRSQHRLKRSRRDFEAALSLRPQWSVAWADLGWTELLLGDLALGEQSLARAVELDPTHLGIGIGRAEYYAALGRPVEAVDELVRLRERNPSWRPRAALAIGRRLVSDADVLTRLQ